MGHGFVCSIFETLLVLIVMFLRFILAGCQQRKKNDLRTRNHLPKNCFIHVNCNYRNSLLWAKVYPIQVIAPPIGGNVRLLTWLSSRTAKR